MKLCRYLTILFFPVMFILSSCNEVPMNSQNNSFKLSEEEINSSIKAVANMRIFFGHQSVGKNILDGINDISEGVNNKINIVESRIADDNSEAAFFHADVGKNKDPFSKIADFRELVENGIGGKVDVAFFKFCYVDFDQTTDIKSTFQQIPGNNEIPERELSANHLCAFHGSLSRSKAEYERLHKKDHREI